MIRYESVDAWFEDLEHYREAFTALRELALEVGLEEAVKWGQPCYMLDGKNVLILSTRKDGAIFSVLKGALVSDPEERLIQPGQDRSSRYLLLADLDEVRAREPYLRHLLAEAIEVQRKGLSVEPLPDTIEYCDELQERLDADEAFREAFEGLTTGRRRHYNMHFGKAKKVETRLSRIEQATERIMMGKGLRDCICGRSKRMPSCDGSHRELEG